MRLSEPTTKIWMEVDHTISGKNVGQWLSFWRYKAYADIRGGSLGKGRQTTVGLSRTAIFSFSAGYFSDTMEMKPALLYSDTRSPACQWSQNEWLWNDPERLFRVKFCFCCRFGWLRPCDFRKIIAWKLIKIDAYCQQRKSSAGIVSNNIRFVQIFAGVL